jgi:hypothetical protein
VSGAELQASNFFLEVDVEVLQLSSSDSFRMTLLDDAKHALLKLWRGSAFGGKAGSGKPLGKASGLEGLSYNTTGT